MEHKDVILRTIPKNYQQQMIRRGAGAHEMVFKNDHFNVTDSLMKVTVEAFGMTPKSIPVKRQLSSLHRVLDHPLRGSYTLCISSYPTDLRAKNLAAEIMYRALLDYGEHHVPGRTLPVWHRLYGNYRDTLRDESSEIPSLLILTNLVADSTNVKFEKARDLLEKYHKIPKIVVCGGMDGGNLFANKLHYPLDAIIHIGPPNRVQED